MASTYGDNFGFRRSDESMAVREGRFKTPASGDPLRIGTAVEIDPDEPGYMKASAAATDPQVGFHGLLVQEEDHISELRDVPGRTSDDYGFAKRDKYSIIWSGRGTKVWFKNTPEKVGFDGYTHDAVDMGTFTGVEVGDLLTWNGTKWVATASANAWMKVTAVSDAADYVEAVLIF